MNIRSTLKRGALVVAAPLAVLASSAHAAIDTSAATTGIADAQTAVLAIIGVLTGMAVAVFAVRKVLKLFGR